MGIVEALKRNVIQRISHGCRWMFFEDGNWVVLEQKRDQKYFKEIVRTNIEAAAVEELTK